MKGLVLILMLALIASHINQINGLAMEGHVAHLGRCKCLREDSVFFYPKQVKYIQVIPRGIHCRRTEVILTLTNNWKYCVQPDTPWVISLLKKLTKRYSTRQGDSETDTKKGNKSESFTKSSSAVQIIANGFSGGEHIIKIS